jgi:hypothetical protein
MFFCAPPLGSKGETELLFFPDLFFDKREITGDATSTACAVSLEKKFQQ